MGIFYSQPQRSDLVYILHFPSGPYLYSTLKIRQRYFAK